VKRLHIFATLGTQNLVDVSQEAPSDEGVIAAVAAEAVTMPVAIIERNELRASQTSDWLGAAATLLGEEFPEAVSAVGLLVAGGELLTGKDLVAVCARKAVTVERHSLVRDATLVDHAVALGASLGKLLLVTRYADKLLVTWDEALVANRLLAYAAAETWLVPLLATELKLLHASAENVATSIAPSSEVVVMAISTI